MKVVTRPQEGDRDLSWCWVWEGRAAFSGQVPRAPTGEEYPHLQIRGPCSQSTVLKAGQELWGPVLGCRAASCPGDRPRRPELTARAEGGNGPWPAEGRPGPWAQGSRI